MASGFRELYFGGALSKGAIVFIRSFIDSFIDSFIQQKSTWCGEIHISKTDMVLPSVSSGVRTALCNSSYMHCKDVPETSVKVLHENRRKSF